MRVFASLAAAICMAFAFAQGCSDGGGVTCNVAEECAQECEAQCAETGVAGFICRFNACQCQCEPAGTGGAGGSD